MARQRGTQVFRRSYTQSRELLVRCKALFCALMSMTQCQASQACVLHTAGFAHHQASAVVEGVQQLDLSNPLVMFFLLLLLIGVLLMGFSISQSARQVAKWTAWLAVVALSVWAQGMVSSPQRLWLLAKHSRRRRSSSAALAATSLMPSLFTLLLLGLSCQVTPTAANLASTAAVPAFGAAATAAGAAGHYANSTAGWSLAATVGGVGYLCKADGKPSPQRRLEQQAWQEESLRFHSAIVDIQWRNGQSAECDIRMPDTAIADSGAGMSYISSQVVKRLRSGTHPIKTAAIYLADGSQMEGPTEGTTAGFRFKGSATAAQPTSLNDS